MKIFKKINIAALKKFYQIMRDFFIFCLVMHYVNFQKNLL